jgi:hypothetical protein
MPLPIFFLHEDDWGEIELLPVENRVHCQDVMAKLRAHTREQASGKQPGKAFVLPDVQRDCRLSERQLRVLDLSQCLEESFTPAPLVQSGSSTSLQTLCNAFAFGEGYGDHGAFYGVQQEGIVFTLCLVLPQSADPGILGTYATALASLAVKHDLFVLDWWHKRVVSVRDPVPALAYLWQNVTDYGARG